MLESNDPGGRQWRELTPERAIGCIVYPATEIEAPGVIRHVYGDRFPLGEPSGEATADVQRLSDAFAKAGMQAPILDRIRDEIWLKLWGNVCLNPISALTHATLDVICSDPTTRALSKAIMLESQAIAENLRRQVPGRCRTAHRRRAQGRRAQDFNAAGSRTRTPDGDRPPGDGGAGNGTADGDSDPCPRRGAGAGRPARENRRAVRQCRPRRGKSPRVCMSALP